MRRLFVLGIALLALSLADPGIGSHQYPTFQEVAGPSGLTFTHGYVTSPTIPMLISTGVAAGDYDRDGDVDLYVVRGEMGPNQLYRNKGDGTFEEVAASAGVAVQGDVGGEYGNGPTFGDFSGDGWLDLIIGGVEGTGPRLFENNRDGTFTEVTIRTTIASDRGTYSTALGDYDKDGDLDLFMAHWTNVPCPSGLCKEHLWRNNGDGTFTSVEDSVGITVYTNGDRTFTPNWADINNDGWPDMVVASDFGSSRIFTNDGDGTFTETTNQAVITDQNGMGASVGDYDNDGDIDWFVTAIYEGPEPEDLTGNRLYRNVGDGTFEDVTDLAGVRHGFWGWGACFADFDNDGYLDLFHVNGMGQNEPWVDDPARLFMNNHNGTFSEMSQALGLVDTASGRGVVCFDYDRDGDIDVLTSNYGTAPKLFRNDGGNDNNYLTVMLRTRGANKMGVGGRVLVTIGSDTQMRELRAGSNFESQDPTEAHFGLGTAASVDELEIQWPDGLVDTYADVAANQLLELHERFVSTVGVYRSDNGTVLLRDANTNSGSKKRFDVGSGGEGWRPVSGDWDEDGAQSLGVWDDAAGQFLLWNGYEGGAADMTVVVPYSGGFVPIAGDWDGDGRDGVGLFDPSTGDFLLWNGVGGGMPDIEFHSSANSSWLPIAGDWNGDGIDSVGLYDAADARFYLRNVNARGGWTQIFRFGPRGTAAVPIAGDWTRDGFDTIGIYRGSLAEFELRNTNSQGPPDAVISFGDRSEAALPVMGAWYWQQ